MSTARNATQADVPLLPWEKSAAADEGAIDRAADSLYDDGADEATLSRTSQEADGDEARAESEDAGEPEGEELEGDESDEGEESGQDDEQPRFRVKVDGEEMDVTLDELTKGYSRQADYTRKTQATAEVRRQAEAVQQAAAQRAQEYAAALQQVEQFLSGTQGEPDWDALRRENPDEFAATFAAHQVQQQRVALVRQERWRAEQEFIAVQHTALAAQLNSERERLIEAVPEWKDTAKAAKEKADLAEYAQRIYGYTPEDLGSVTDHRLMVILRKAAAYDRLQAKGGEIRKQAKTRPVLKPGSPTPPSKGRSAARKRAHERLARTGSTKAAASVIYNMLGDE